MAAPKKTKGGGTSLALFKAWLSGIEEMQGEDWTPDAAQWQRIKAKLFEIEEVPAVEVAPQRPAAQPYVPQYAPAPMHSAFEAAPRMPAHNQMGQPFNGMPSQKTPDIDSTGGYTSDLV